MVEKALRELRSKHVISERFEAEIAPGEARVGFVVTPHAALCVQTSRACTMVGQLRAPGAWVMLENGPAIWVEELS
jgi:hypothetical protein